MHKLGKVGCLGFLFGVVHQLTLAYLFFVSFQSANVALINREVVLLKIIPLSCAGLALFSAAFWKVFHDSVFQV